MKRQASQGHRSKPYSKNQKVKLCVSIILILSSFLPHLRKRLFPNYIIYKI